MSSYAIPQSVYTDLEGFRKGHSDFAQGKLDALTFKTIRVPFGIYEQREPDTYMLRLKSAACSISPKQLRGLAKLAGEYANPLLHITTRGGVQLHYAKYGDLVTLTEKIMALGLSGRGSGGNTVRNIVADPLAGIAPDEPFDVTPYANALTTKMLALKDSYNLPRKFKIAFSSSSADRAVATITDVGFIATIKDGKRGFVVYLAGGMGAKMRLGYRFLDFLPAEEAFLLAQATKQVFDRTGNRRNKHAARLRFVADNLGEEKLNSLVLAEMESLRNTIDWQLDLHEIQYPAPVVEPLPTMSEEQKLWWNRFVIPQKQQGYFAAKIPLKLGDIPTEWALKLADMLEPLGEETIRFTSSQNMYLCNLRAKDLLHIYPLIMEYSEQSKKPAVIGDMVACTGAATCQLGICRPRGATLKIEEQLARENLDLDSIQGFNIHISGCPNSCGNHATGDLGFFGKVLREDGYPYPAYNVLVGAIIEEGKTQLGRKIGEVAAFHLPRFVSEVLRLWTANKPKHADFRAYLASGGEEEIIALSKKYKKVPNFKDDKNPYFDFSSDELFSLKGRGTGECSAGMYDLIEADKKAMLELVEAARSGQGADYDQICLLACRMLLVARGQEARDKDGVYRAFKLHFIEAGLIDQKYLPAIKDKCDSSVLELADAVVALYATMDNSFNFQNKDIERVAKDAPESGGSAGGAGGNAGAFADFRGVACPMNFVKTKMELSKLPSGALLEILLDDGAPIENVPASLKGEGHTILATTREGAHWRVRIQKA